MSTRTMRISGEYQEGYEAYGEGVDGYEAQPYEQTSQEFVDWFAGWLEAREADQA